MSENTPCHDVEMKGWLMKWTNYIKCYQRRWFVLSNGVFSYYRNQAEVAHTCRGAICLQGALIHTVDSCTFVISNGCTQTFHIKAANEVERQRWVTALELAKAKAIRVEESEDEENAQFDRAHKREMEKAVKDLKSRLEDLQTCSELITKHGCALQCLLSELECHDNTQDFTTKLTAINEQTTHFRISSNAMLNACSEFLELAQSHGHKWQKMLRTEQDQRHSLEELVEQLARQQIMFEQAAKTHQMQASLSSTSDDEGAEFYDAESDQITPIVSYFNDKKTGLATKSLDELVECDNLKASPSGRDVEEQLSLEQLQSTRKHLIPSFCCGKNKGKKTKDKGSAVPSPESHKPELCSSVVGSAGMRRRRTRVPDRPNCSLNLWSTMKNCIGKELTKIPMPVNFSEPLSMLQRLTEDFEYADVLHRAAELSDSTEQLAYVAAFTVSGYSSTANRTGKPFNPLLGETYECDRRDDLGWRAISEQVSHHPPMVAQYCEGKGWVCWQEFTMTSKFRGKYLQVVPVGTAHCRFTKSGNHYTWSKVTTTVHNIIVGKLWLDQQGDTDIVNHRDGSKCKLTYVPYSYFTRDVQRTVTGCVTDPLGQARWLIKGTWDGSIEIAPVSSIDRSPEKPVYKTGNYVTVWKKNDPPPDNEKFYNLSLLACQLNEMEEGVAPTDSRLRPDQRLMEEGCWQEANQMKLELEEKQRKVRRERQANASEGLSYESVWFKKETEPVTGQLSHMYKGAYWNCKENQDWSMCPHIFSTL